jgi:tetraacyldisaccharide-1-P 4'-kinase
MLQQLGLPLSLWKRFPDHYPYRLATVRRLLQDCLRQSIRWVVTTEKDFVRLRPFVAEFQRCGVGLLTLALRVEFAEGASLLWERLDALL